MKTTINKYIGFSIIELIMVIVIIGITTAMIIPRFVTIDDDANVALIKNTASAFREAINNTHAYWILSGQRGAIANFSGLHDNSFNFNSSGYPVESGDQLRPHPTYSNTMTHAPNHNRCWRLWNNLLKHSQPLDKSGLGNKDVNGNTTWYYSIENGLFVIVTATGGLCEYALMKNQTMKIRYNSQNGKVIVIGV